MNEAFNLAEFMVLLFGMVGTVGAALAAWFSSNSARDNLKEQSENNKRAIMPFLVLEDKKYEIEYIFKKPRLQLNWDTNEYNLDDNFSSIGTSIEIINISKGVARDIKASVEIKNVSRLIKMSSKIDSDMYLSIESDKADNDFKTFLLTGMHHGFYYSTEYKIDNFPASNYVFIEADGGRKELRIPNAFLVMCNFILINHYVVSESDLPYLIITLTYYDLVGNDYKKDYKFSVSGLSKDKVLFDREKASIKFKITPVH